MGLSEELQRAIDEMGYYLPTEVQDETIPLILGGGDVMVAAPTGSGKTAAFALPIIELVAHKKTERDLSSLFTLSPGACITGRGFEAVGEKWSGARLERESTEFSVRVVGNGVVRIGWSFKGASLDLGSDDKGIGYGGTAKKVFDGHFDTFGEAYGHGDLVRSVLQDEAVEFFLNGTSQGIVNFDRGGENVYPTVSARRGACEWLLLDDDEALLSSEEERTTLPGRRRCSAIILEPSRDLAEQTHDCFLKYSQYVKDFTCHLLIGGCDTRTAERACSEGRCDLITGTPRKVMDCVRRGILDVSSARFLVLDEADRFGDEQHEDKRAALEIFDAMPKGASRTTRLQVAFFSATLHSQSVRILADRLCDQPTWVDLKGERHVPDSVHHLVVSLDPKSRHRNVFMKTDGVHRGGRLDGPLSERVDSEFIKRAKPHVLLDVLDKLKVDQVMVFCRTNLDCDLLQLFLEEKNKTGGVRAYSCCVLAGARGMKERRKSLQAFKAGEVRIMICTDVAARGIDVKGLPFVVNMTLPDSEETYVHRVGRVGRSDKIGLAISIVANCPEKVWYCQKNKKPPQSDTRLFKDGGNCIWYDEPKLLEAIRKRVEKVWTVKPDNIALPDDLRTLQFGDKEKIPSLVRSKQDDVETLKRLGTQSQRGFFKLQRIMLTN